MGHGKDRVSNDDDPPPKSASGAVARKETTFRGWVTADGSSRHRVESGRYHLYVSHACPWSHRTTLARALLGLDDAITLSILHPFLGDEGWTSTPDRASFRIRSLGAKNLRQVYLAADPQYAGRATVPVLWDRTAATIVNNDSRQILRMLATDLSTLGRTPRQLSPPELRGRIDEVLDAIHAPINDGVYRAGFAREQSVHTDAVRTLFAELDRWERELSGRRFLCGPTLTEADLCLFTTLFRFDAAYATLFKCNVRRIVDYPNLWGFVRDVYETPRAAEVCHLDHVKEHYYRSHPKINPTRIVAIGRRARLHDAPRPRTTLLSRTLRGSRPR